MAVADGRYQEYDLVIGSITLLLTCDKHRRCQVASNVILLARSFISLVRILSFLL